MPASFPPGVDFLAHPDTIPPLHLLPGLVVMKRSLTVAALAVSALSGCGTVCNLQEGGTPYGGVSQTAKAGADAWDYWRHPQGACIPPSFDLARAIYLFALDLPLSAVGDTLTLPVTIW